MNLQSVSLVLVHLNGELVCESSVSFTDKMSMETILTSSEKLLVRLLNKMKSRISN